MASAAEPQRVVGPGKPKLVEEATGHGLVVVLAGIHEDLLADPAQDGRRAGALDQLRRRADDTDDSHLVRRLPAGREVGRAAAGGVLDADPDVADLLRQLDLAQAVAPVEDYLELREEREVEPLPELVRGLGDDGAEGCRDRKSTRL